MKVGEDNFVVLQGWMLAKEYDLTARELIILGLINGFSQDGDSKFQGNLSYIQEWSRSKSRTTAIETLKSLEGKGLIVKENELINGVLFNRYRAIYRGSTKIEPPVQKLDRGSTKIEHNNIYNISTSTNTPPINNLFDNINKSENEKQIRTWLIEGDIEIRMIQFKQLGLIDGTDDFDKALDEQIEKFYKQCRLDGKGDLILRGRSEVIKHFNNWLNRTNRFNDDSANRKGDSRSEEGFLSMLGC